MGDSKSRSSAQRATPPRERTRFGRAIEERVGAALEARGFIVLGRNQRVGHDEVDVLALDGTTLVLIEVRARANASCDEALASVNRKKVRFLKRAALTLLASKEEQREVRIDVVAVGTDRVEHLENAIDFSEP
ncbi:MAG: YraN family protein [Polyangiales bacterium]